jgi:hypothetical protein
LLMCGTHYPVRPAGHTTERDREREERSSPSSGCQKTEEGSLRLAAPGDGGLAGIEEAVRKDRGAQAHP